LLIENLLARQASDKRKQDNYYLCKFTPTKDRKGIYIDYQVSSDRDLITLLTVLTDPQGKKVQLAYCSDDSQSSIDQIQEEIKNLNIYGMVEMVSRLINS
jgi:uracil phosphoribosyltransferase